MQFTGQNRVAILGLAVFGVGALVFGSGVFVGRRFPSHRFEKFGETRYLLDATTGRVCDPFKDPKADPFAQYRVKPNASTNPFDHLTDQGGSAPASGPPDPFAPYGGHVVKPPPDYPPPCGK